MKLLCDHSRNVFPNLSTNQSEIRDYLRGFDMEEKLEYLELLCVVTLRGFLMRGGTIYRGEEEGLEMIGLCGGKKKSLIGCSGDTSMIGGGGAYVIVIS